LPVITVPTLVGSGAEIKPGMVITDGERAEKRATGSQATCPRTAILDPAVLRSVPSGLLAGGIVDMISHVLEPYFNSEELFLEIQDNLAEAMLSSLYSVSQRLINKKIDDNDFADLMWASPLSFHSIIFLGRGMTRYEVHQIAHAVSGEFNIPHGATIAAVLPAWISVKVENELQFRNKMKRLIRNLFSLEHDGDCGATKLRSWIEGVGAPTNLSEFGITRNAVGAIMSNIERTALTLFDSLSRRDVEKILQRAISGEYKGD